MKKIMVSTLFFCSFLAHAMVVDVKKEQDGWSFGDNRGQTHKVASHFVSPFVRSMSQDQLKLFTEQGNRIRAIRLSNNEYRLQETIPGNGGGLLLGLAATLGTALVGATTTLVAAVASGPAFPATLVAGAVATKAAVITVGVVTLAAPTP